MAVSLVCQIGSSLAASIVAMPVPLLRSGVASEHETMAGAAICYI